MICERSLRDETVKGLYGKGCYGASPTMVKLCMAFLWSDIE